MRDATARDAAVRWRARLAVGGYPLIAGGWVIGFMTRLGRWSLVGTGAFLLGILLTSLRAERRHRLAPRQLHTLAATAELPTVPVLLVTYASVVTVALGLMFGMIRLLTS